jgi:hypothetical protein
MCGRVVASVREKCYKETSTRVVNTCLSGNFSAREGALVCRKTAAQGRLISERIEGITLRDTITSPTHIFPLLPPPTLSFFQQHHHHHDLYLDSTLCPLFLLFSPCSSLPSATPCSCALSTQNQLSRFGGRAPRTRGVRWKVCQIVAGLYCVAARPKKGGG